MKIIPQRFAEITRRYTEIFFEFLSVSPCCLCESLCNNLIPHVGF